MPAELKQRLDRLESKAAMVARSHEGLLRRLQEQSRLIAGLESRVRSLEAENSELRTAAEYLRVVHTVAPTREAVSQTRALLSRIVREIDRCIADIGDGCNEG